jgi:2-polyprenyl-3-methyl-5-hydroxy-6-metoxy-1,4-benzoquinol methylase
MAFLQIKSDNPDLSFILKKNPSSGMLVKGLRRGTLFGYFSDSDTYNIYFRDSYTELSYPEYKDQRFEYINTTRYNSNQFILNAFTELIRDAYKKQSIHDVDGYTNSVICNLVFIANTRVLDFFKTKFSDIDLEYEEAGHKQYRIIFKSKNSLYFLLNTINIFALFNVIRNDNEYLYLDESVAEKYTTSLDVVDAPYYIRYLFKISLFRSERLFAKYKSRLETSERYPIVLEHGDTLTMRKAAISKHLDLNYPLIDLGCGEGSYVSAFAPKLHEVAYYAIDIDDECRSRVEHRVTKKELKNVHILESLDECLPILEQSSQVLCTEVIEHMPEQEARLLIQKCLDHPKIHKVILTTPNVSFNTHYFDEDKFRHLDHVFEYSKQEFITWLSKLSQDEFELDVFDIGDKVAGEATTLGAVFRRKL